MKIYILNITLFAASLCFVLSTSAQTSGNTTNPTAEAAQTESIAQEPDATTETTETTETAEVAEAAGPQQLWDKANMAYMVNRFSDAIKLYSEILEQGYVSTELYYNIANAYFRTGQTARAILYYNRALAINPEDEDIRHNLQIAESLTKDKIESVPEFFLYKWLRSLRNMLGCTAWTVISIIMLAAVLAMGIAFLLAERYTVRKWTFFGMLAAAMLFATATGFAAAQRDAMINHSQAIVMTSGAPVKSSPDNSATDLFILNEGTKVRVSREHNSWYEIVIADGRKGWIRSSSIEEI